MRRAILLRRAVLGGKAFFLATLLSLQMGVGLCHAQEGSSSRTPTSITHYQFGDDPDGKLHWADPQFDDTAWKLARDNRWAIPDYFSDGFMWVRVRVPVAGGSDERLALRIEGDDSHLLTGEVFVNGWKIAKSGTISDIKDAVLDIPPGMLSGLSTAVVALRVQYDPFTRANTREMGAQFSLNESRILHLEQEVDRDRILFRHMPELTLYLIIALLGIGLLGFWKRGGGREVLLCSLWLISIFVVLFLRELLDLDLVPLSWRAGDVLWIVMQFAFLLVFVEFIWAIHHLRLSALKLFWYLTIVLFIVSLSIMLLSTRATGLDFWAHRVARTCAFLIDAMVVAVNLWVLLVRKENRLVAISLVVGPVVNIPENLGIIGSVFSIGALEISVFGLLTSAVSVALFVTLGGRARQAWLIREELRIEIDAARDVQLQLVQPAASIPGFEIESAYTPAKQVGGDFFQVLPITGGVLVIVGDVSGKGLRAAMTVSTIVGALRIITSESPSEILSSLNHGLAGHLRGGFVTCGVAKISQDGNVAIASAGHPSPYLDGAEIQLSAGFPLGIVPECSYNERLFLMKPDQHLTFVSDGVIEARNCKGELFGFERTEKISTSRASAIAQAAINFGQDDDITVVTVSRLAGQFESVTQLPAPNPSASTV